MKLKNISALAVILLLLIAPNVGIAAYLFSSPENSIGKPPQETYFPQAKYLQHLERIEDQKFYKLKHTWGSKTYHSIALLSVNDHYGSGKMATFLRTLELEKPTLMKLTGLTNRQYNRLAVMAFGIVGVESKFFSSNKLIIKETLPEAVTAVKHLRRALGCDPLNIKTWDKCKVEEFTSWDPKETIQDNLMQTVQRTAEVWDKTNPGENSRGPTQIKSIYLPKKVRDYYGITPDNLMKPEIAAVATIGFLYEALHELNTYRRSGLTYINAGNIYDYVAYIYNGPRRSLFLKDKDGQWTVRPENKTYNRQLHARLYWIELYEAPAAVQEQK